MSNIEINTPIVFLRIAWMKDYEGVTDTDIPKGAGSYVAKNKTGEEIYNYLAKGGKYYGFARIHGGANINITKLGASKDATQINNVTVVFFATNPTYRSQYIVGWYKNATLFKKLQKVTRASGVTQDYVTSCNVADGKLLPIKERNYEVTGPGQTNLWYPNSYLSKDELKKLLTYLNNPSAKPRPEPKPSRGRGWLRDAELRKKIEVAAMDATADWFEQKGFKISDVHKDNKGWDLEASKGNITLQLEVKGTQGGFNGVEVTANEYKNIKKKSKSFRLCVVSNAIDKKNQQTDVFFYKDNAWVNDKNQDLTIEEVVSARVKLK